MLEFQSLRSFKIFLGLPTGFTDNSQAVHNGASFPALPLPLVHLSQQVEESLLGVGNVAVCRPAQELELTHHQLALLELQKHRSDETHVRFHARVLMHQILFQPA